MTKKAQEAYKISNRLSQKWKYQYHTIIKTIKVHNKERILKTAREKAKKNIQTNVSELHPNSQWRFWKKKGPVLLTQEDYECQATLLIPRKLSISLNGEYKIFHDQVKYKSYHSTNPTLQKY